jgi:hypothetical protein
MTTRPKGPRGDTLQRLRVALRELRKVTPRPRHEEQKRVCALVVVVGIVELAGKGGEEASGNLSHTKGKTEESGNPPDSIIHITWDTEQ